MNKRRLLKLADLLEADAKNENGIRFSLFDWGVQVDPKRPLSCGTKACAMGLAALSGAFKRAGLEYEVKRTGEIVIKHGNTKSPILAAMRTFDISRGDAEYLFANSRGLTDYWGAKGEKSAAQRIRNFVGG